MAERSNKSIRNLLKKHVFEKRDDKSIAVLPTTTKQYNNRVHTSTKLTPIQASLEKNERYIYYYLLDKRKQIKPKFQVNDFIRVANLNRTFSKRDRTNWSNKLYKITEIIIDTIPSYKIVILKERYNEALLRKTELTKKEKKDVMKKSNIT